MTQLQTVLLVEDHKAILDHLISNASQMFGDAKVTVISDPSAISQIDVTASFDMGLVDPGLPGIPHDNIVARVKFALQLLSQIKSPEHAAVFTGIATEPERVLFEQAGYGNYFSKADTSIYELTEFFRHRTLLPTAPKPIHETWTFLSESELSAHTLKDYHPDRTYRELASMDGKSEEAFTQALKRARRKIRDYSN